MPHSFNQSANVQAQNLYMGKIIAYNFATLNGYFKGPKEDLGWHSHGVEESKFAAENLKSGNILLFGRVTYEMMAGYWPTPDAIRDNPEVAEGMNRVEKIVFSKTLKKTAWNNSRVVNDNMIEELKKLKKAAGKDMTILGSGSIITQLADHGLIDEYQFMLDPVALGDGTPMFKGMKNKLDLELVKSKTFESGVILLCYQPQTQKSKEEQAKKGEKFKEAAK